MAGLTSSVASAVSELSLSDVDLGSSVHSTTASRRLSAQAPPTGESSQVRESWRKAWCQVMLLMCVQKAWGSTIGDLVLGEHSGEVAM